MHLTIRRATMLLSAGELSSAPVVAVVALVLLPPLAFLAAPWPLEVKALAALHGLCAQQPSHSFSVAGRQLPLDARMSGMYLGFVATQAVLWRRLSAAALVLPPVRQLAALFLCLVALAVDGLNSSLADLGLGHLYHPSNALRYGTGALAGLAMAILFRLLLGLSLPGAGGHAARRLFGSRREVTALLSWLALAGILARGASGWLYGPLALALLASCVVALACFALGGFILLAGLPTAPARRLRMITAALLLAYLSMFALAAARFWLEAHVVLAPTAG